MLQSIQGNSFLIMLIMVFVAFLLLVQGLHLIWRSYKGPNAKKIEQRINALSASLDRSTDAQLLKRQMLSDLPVLERFLLNLPRAQRLQRFIHQAGLNLTVSTLLLLTITFGITAFLLLTSLAHQSLMFSMIVAGISSALPWLYVQRIRSRRLRRIEQQLPDALDLLTRALRSGHAFSSGLQMLGEEMIEPLAGEFQIVHDEINFGVSLQQALINLSERIPLTDLRYFVVSVLIQRESGGNLTEVLSNLSRLIRERLKLLSKVRVLSAEGRLSAWILGIMPFALAGLMNAMNPDFMAPLWNDPLGETIVKYTLTLMAVGIIILIKIIKIRV